MPSPSKCIIRRKPSKIEKITNCNILSNEQKRLLLEINNCNSDNEIIIDNFHLAKITERSIKKIQESITTLVKKGILIRNLEGPPQKTKRTLSICFESFEVQK